MMYLYSLVQALCYFNMTYLHLHNQINKYRVFSRWVWKKLSGLHGALTSTAYNTFIMFNKVILTQGTHQSVTGLKEEGILGMRVGGKPMMTDYPFGNLYRMEARPNIYTQLYQW